MDGKMINPEKLQSVENENFSDSIITVFALRHGESESDKTNSERDLTKQGTAEVREATKNIIKEVLNETDPKTKIEFRLYDSGAKRTNTSLLVAAGVLREQGYDPQMPVKGIRRKVGPIIFPKEARVTLGKEADEIDRDLLTHLLSDDELRLKGMGMETPKEVSERFSSGIESTSQIAQGLRNKGYHRKTVAIVFTHDIPIGSYLQKKLGIDPLKLGKIDNAQGLKIDFTGRKDARPMIQLWGQGMEGKQI